MRGAACGLLSTTSLVCLLWGFWPPRSESLRLTLDLKRAPESLQSGIGTPRWSGENVTPSPAGALYLAFEYPQQVRLGDRALARLWIGASDNQTAMPEPVSADASSLERAEPPPGIRPAPAFLEAELELPGDTILPAGPIRQPLTNWGPTEFVWAIGPMDAGAVRGTAWLYAVDSTLKEPAEARRPLAAMPVEISGALLLGMRGSTARQVGFVAAVLGLILGMPFLEASARRGQRRFSEV